jgi:hypothetical protein
MPKIRRQNFPPRLLNHLLDRITQREISGGQLGQFADWLVTEPEVPEGPWFKRFPEMIVCGEGSLVKTFLRAVSCWRRSALVGAEKVRDGEAAIASTCGRRALPRGNRGLTHSSRPRQTPAPTTIDDNDCDQPFFGSGGASSGAMYAPINRNTVSLEFA